MDSFASAIASLACSRGLCPRTPAQPPRRSAEREITTTSAQRFIICAMNEESLPSFATVALRSFPGGIRRALNKLFGRSRRRREDDAPDFALRSRAASAIREYAAGHATLFERAERLREKAERLERAGTPSESARNRAERATKEVRAGLAALRATFAASAGGSEGRRAFDREVEHRYPAFRLSGGSS
jgi:hypothetical protein